MYIYIYIVCTYTYEPYGMEEDADSCQYDMPRGQANGRWMVQYSYCMSESNDAYIYIILHRDIILMIHIEYAYNIDLSSIRSISR